MIINWAYPPKRRKRKACLTCTGLSHLPSLFLQVLDLLSNDCQLVSSICSDEFISLQRKEIILQGEKVSVTCGHIKMQFKNLCQSFCFYLKCSSYSIAMKIPTHPRAQLRRSPHCNDPTPFIYLHYHSLSALITRFWCFHILTSCHQT